MKTTTSPGGRNGWLLLILLVAAFLRFFNILDVPPGLTHDEADHGITAWQIVNGARAIYFTVGYGREPLYDYSTSALMAFLGPTYLAGRLAAVMFSMLMLAGMYGWVRLALGPGTALLTAAGAATGFWALMTSRQSLRSETLPALFVLALLFYWRGVTEHPHPEKRRGPLTFWLGGALLGITFYTYVPARAMWAIFPGFLAYAAVRDRALFRRVWRGTALMLLIAGIVALPLFIYLLTNPGAEARIWQLSQPITSALDGDLGLLLENVAGSLRLFTFSGDSFWRYNIPGRPLLQPVMGVLFYLGLGTAAWRTVWPAGRSHAAGAHAMALLWLLAGMAPALITGPTLSMTQAIGMQPVLYLFPAIGIISLRELAIRTGNYFGVGRHYPVPGRLAVLVPTLLYTMTGMVTMRDYFGTWAQAPEVRVQYEATMVAAMRYLNETGSGAVAVSTVSPGRFHSQAVAEMTLRNEKVEPRWFDARNSLLLPAPNESKILLPGFAPLAPELAAYFSSAELVTSLPMRATDLDRPLDVYRVNRATVSAEWLNSFEPVSNESAGPIRFGESAELLGYDLRTPAVAPGGVVRLATLWRVLGPMEGGILFTHVQGDNGVPVAQADRLDVPSDAWRTDDMFIQLHQIAMPVDANLEEYLVVVGMCQQSASDCRRLPVDDGDHGDDLVRLTTVSVIR